MRTRASSGAKGGCRSGSSSVADLHDLRVHPEQWVRPSWLVVLQDLRARVATGLLLRLTLLLE